MKCKITWLISACLVFASLFVLRSFFPSSRATFEKFVMQPVPASVHFLGKGSNRAMDSSFQVLHFRIDRSDLQRLLAQQEFIPIPEEREFKRWDQGVKEHIRISREEFFLMWVQRIRNVVGLSVAMSKDWSAYLKERGNSKGYIFSNSAGTEVVFVAETF